MTFNSGTSCITCAMAVSLVIALSVWPSRGMASPVAPSEGYHCTGEILTPVLRSAEIDAAVALSKSEAMNDAIAKARGMWLEAAGRQPESDAEMSLLAKDLYERAVYVSLIAQNNDPDLPTVTQAGWRSVELCGQRLPAAGMIIGNQDNVYYHVPIRGDVTYVLRGRETGKAPLDFSFKLALGWPNLDTVDTLAGSAVRKKSDGSFEIIISSEGSGDDSNRLTSMAGREQSLMIRETLGDWSAERPHLYTVEKIKSRATGADVESREFAPERVADLYLKYTSDMTRIMRRFIGYRVNTMSEPFNSGLGGGLAVQLNAEGKYDLPPDEALVVTIDPGSATYFNIQVIDPWLAHMDSEDRIGELNNSQSHRSRDGTYTYIISHQDPSRFNWLNVARVPKGFLYARFQGFPGIEPPAVGSEHFPKISMKILELRDLEDVAKDQVLSPDERTLQLRARAEDYKRRFIVQQPGA